MKDQPPQAEEASPEVIPEAAPENAAAPAAAPASVPETTPEPEAATPAEIPTEPASSPAPEPRRETAPANAPAATPDEGCQQPAPAATGLEEQLRRVTAEREDFRRRLESAEASLRVAAGGGEGEDVAANLLQDNQKLRATLRKATDLLREKITMCVNQEKHNQALKQQIASLKEVLACTRDLLNIRNMEVDQLQKDVDSMGGKIEENRRRQSAMIAQMETANKINGELRSEYETQLKLFQSLKQRYEEKVAALTRRNAIEVKATNSEDSEVFVDAQDQIAPSQGNI